MPQQVRLEEDKSTAIPLNYRLPKVRHWVLSLQLKYERHKWFEITQQNILARGWHSALYSLQEKISEIVVWLGPNHIVLHVEKKKLMCFTNHPKQANIYHDVFMHSENYTNCTYLPLKQEKVGRYLGIYLAKHTNLGHHIERVANILLKIKWNRRGSQKKRL